MNLAPQLHALAQRLLDGLDPADAAVELQAIAARNPVALPVINPGRDDTQHWQDLTDRKLAGEVGADAWNLAAGLHEQAFRKTAALAKLRADIATFTNPGRVS